MSENDNAIEEKCTSCLGDGVNYGRQCYTCDGTGYMLTDLGKQVWQMVKRRIAR